MRQTSLSIFIVIGLLVIMALGGCTSATHTQQAPRRYPAGVAQGETLPIQVVVDSRRVVLTNSTGTVFGPSVLWLNQWYSVAIDGLSIGETVSIPIGRFIDEHGQQMRGGGFFATESPERIILAELRTDRGMLGMPVVDPNTTSR